VEANWERLRAGVSGLGAVTRFAVGDYPVKNGGQAPDPPAGGTAGGEAPGLEMGHLLGAVAEAMRGAGLASGRVPDPARAAVVIGSSLAGSSAADRFFADYREKGPAAADYALLEDYYIEEQLRLLAERAGAEGPALLVSNACAAGGSSVAQAARWLLAGRADLVIAAGYDPLSVFTFGGFGSLQALSPTGVRPFSRHRDGMLLGDGFAALVIERQSDAKRRSDAKQAGRRPLALLAGWGEATDAHHLTHPHPQGAGAALAMRRALARAALPAEAIDYINCHGTGTRPNDVSEVRAMRRVFGARLASIPMSSSKPFFGHTLGGAGTVEAVVAILALARGFLPATLNLDEVEPEFAGLDFLPRGRAARVGHVMSNSFGFGGANTSLIFSAYEGVMESAGLEGGKE
jgi:3-oxoacyl-[acyl-carrier-protein] synthase II